MDQHATASHDPSVPLVKKSSSNAKYAVINVYDIDQQVGLVECPGLQNQYYVIAPYYVFDVDLRSTAGRNSLI